MNICSAAFLLSLCYVLSTSAPIDDLLDSNDSLLVGSNINKVYAPAPIDDLLVAGTGAKSHGKKGHSGQKDDENGGFYTSKSTKDDNGYKHFDSFHKKGGDKYGFEKHSTYGKETGGKKGGSHQTSSAYHEVDGDGHETEFYSGSGSEAKGAKLKNKKSTKDHNTAATDGDFFYSTYEGEGEGDFERILSGDGDYYEGEGGHSSEAYEEGEEGSESSANYEGEGDYYGEGESKQQSVVHHGSPKAGSTSYSVRHF